MFGKVFRRLVSFILVFSMLSEISVPLAYAAGNTENSMDAGSANLFANVQSKGEVLKASDSTIAFENLETRSEYTKDYRLTDGSDAVFLYPISVHEKDAQGKWAEIDNQLQLKEIKAGEGTFNAFAASGTGWQTLLYEEPKAGNFLTLETSKGSLGWGLKAIGSELFEGLKTAPEYTDPEVEKGYEKMRLKSLSGILSYKEVLSGLDLKYQLLGKDEVTSSTLVSSSTKGPLEFQGVLSF